MNKVITYVIICNFGKIWKWILIIVDLFNTVVICFVLSIDYSSDFINDVYF